MQVSAEGGGVESNGFTGATIWVRNKGAATCHLAGSITGLYAGDQRAPYQIPTEPTASDHGGPQDVPPGGTVGLHIASRRLDGSAECFGRAPAGKSHPERLIVALSKTGTLVATLGGGHSYTLACWPVVVSRLFRPDPAE